MDIIKELFLLQDLEYKEFHSKLIPNISADFVIGVRTPVLRSFAKEFAKTKEADEFLDRLPHIYYEENNLHAFLLENRKDYVELIHRLDEFLPYVDNWATCDFMRPKILKKHLPELYVKIQDWLKSEDVYKVRFAIEMLMTYYLDDEFKEEYVELVANVRSEEYYVNMMIAWYFATALAKQYDTVFPFITDNRLSCWTHNKAIQKAIESRRISSEQKDVLRKLKRKEDIT